MHYETDGFPARLKKIRQNCGYTQQQMADVLAIHRTTYTYYELGRTNPPREVLNKLVEIFNISFDDLLASESTARSGKLHSAENTREADKIYNLSKEERTLLMMFRTMSAEEQTQLMSDARTTISTHHRLDLPEK